MSANPLSIPNPEEHLRLQAALRESEILRELADLLASSMDLDNRLQALVKRTSEVCEVERCAVWLMDDTRGILRPKTYHLSSQTLDRKTIKAANAIWYRSSLAVDDPAVQHLLKAGGMLYLEDLRSEPTMQHMAETFLARSTLLVALMREGRPVGMLSLDDPAKKRAFSAEQQQLARAIGQQAATAIDNARLYQQAQTERKRAERLIERARSTYQVALTVNASEDLSTVFRVAMENLVRQLGADGGAIALIETGELRLVSSHFGYAPSSEYTRVQLDQLPICRHVATTGQPLYIKEEQVAETELLFYRKVGLHNTIIVPLIVSASSANQDVINETRLDTPDRCVGLAFVNYYTHSFQPAKGQLAYAQDIAAQCALAVEKFRLLAEVRQAAAVATERATTLDTIFHAMTEGITLTDMQGNVMILNDAASHFLGIPKNYKNHLNAFLRRYPTYTVEGRPMPEEDFPLTRALRGERIRAERFVTRRADGEERILEINIAPMHDSHGKQIGVVSAFRDVSESIRAEQRIRQALDTMLHVAEAVSGVIDIKDILRSVLERTLITLNCQRGAVYLFDEEQQKFLPLFFIGFGGGSEEQWLKDQQFWLESATEEYHGFYRQIIDGHAVLVNAEQCPYQPNPFSHIMILAAPIKHNNRVHGLILLDRSLPNAGACDNDDLPPETSHPERREFSIWDIAVLEGIAQLAGLAVDQARWQQEALDARTSEAAMREANALKDEFMAITAHEFRSPLTVILAQSQLVARVLARLQKQIPETNQESIQKATRNLSIVEDQTRQLTDIVKTFLEVTHITRGQLTLNMAEVDLGEIAQRVVNQSSATTQEHTINCILDPSGASYIVRGDSARLQQIIANLVENAIKYSPLGGPIIVKLRSYMTIEAQKKIEVCVEDRGIGVPPDAQSRLFERFYRAPNSASSQTKGIGLGLYVVAQLLQLQGGEIHVESNGRLGEGSRFVFTLPALESIETVEHA
ncbi:MAG TPA: GAF domain-containing protein [Ktedonobacteraceae bacterium]|nr:GAF domain-containing protein [Ktedonobacteraceae bacterium]